MKYFSMFAGIGGFEAAFPSSWECVGYSEINPYATTIYCRHYPNHKGYGDATGIDTTTLPDFDLLTGGFPCQPFSVAGKRKGFADARGTLFFEVARLLSDKRPRYFLLENVKGLLSIGDGQVFTQILGILSNIGYDCQWEVLNSKHFGVPQNRERIFIVGHLRTEPRPDVFPIHRTSPEDDSIQPKGSKQRVTAQCIRDRYGQRWTDETYILSRARGYFPGGVNTHAPSLSTSSYAHNHLVALTDNNTTPQASRVYDAQGIYPSLRVPDGRSGLPTIREQRIRKLMPIECERLQAFPDNYTEWGIDEDGKRVTISNTQRYKCLGNAVTVSVVAAIAEKLKGELR